MSAIVLMLVVGASGVAAAAPCEVEPGVDGAAGGAGAVTADQAASGDPAKAREACERARARFGALFGEPVPGVRIVLWDRPGYRVGLRGGRAVVFWPTSRAMAARAARPADAERHVAAQWSDVLPHEISHVLLAARFYGGRDAVRSGYGTPLPDWLDEAVAIWAEPEGSRLGRLAQARALTADRLDLGGILPATHPAAGNAAAYTARDGTAPLPGEALRAFYARSFAVLAFVRAEGGVEAVRELVRRLVENPADRGALAGLPGLPGDVAGVEAAWRSWLAAGAADHAGASRVSAPS